MTYPHPTLRPAMTAIAAVLALTATPSLAQSTETPAPIVESTPSPAPSSPDPLAPEPTATTSSPEPVASETTAAPAPAANARTTARASRQPARSATPRTTRVTRSQAATPVAAAAAPAAAPVAAEPLITPPEMAAPAPIAAPIEPVAEAPPAQINGVTIEEALPYAGAAGLGLLALAGTGVAMRRRRRRREDAIEEAKWQHIESRPESAFEPDPVPMPAAEIEPAPTFVRAPMADPMPVAAAATTAGAASQLPDGFDISQFGPHVQAAYRGPTPDNPSASLKRRLTVGHFLDKKAAEAGTAAPVAATAAAKPPTAKPGWGRTDSDFMFRRPSSNPAPSKPGLRPAYQK